MGKPRLIILIRHAQSEGNKNREIHQTLPDHRVHLTPEGHQQALEAGRKLRALLRPDDTLHFFTSPYRRTRETTEGILSALTSDDPSPSPFPRNTIKVYEEPRLREQDFGNFQPCSAEMERMWQERADYGHFFYRIPNGESAADAYDRISGFNDSLWRRFEENDFASVCILVTHGLMTRVFLMKWYHFSVEYFEDLRNVNHCEFVVMKKNLDNGKFILQNQLRTWSELKRERAARDSASQSNLSFAAPGVGDSPIPQRRRWGGCPDGCDHSQHNHGSRHPQPRRQNTADLFKDDNELLSASSKDASRILSRHNSISVNQTRSPPRAQPVRERYRPQTGDTNGGGAGNNDLSLPDDEDTILDQDPEKALTTSLPSQSTGPIPNRSLKHRFRPAQPVSMSLNEALIEEELSPKPHTDDVPTPKQSSGETTPQAEPRTDRPSKSLRRKLRSPREAALIAMVGRDGGGSLSGAGSSDEEDEKHPQQEQGTQSQRQQPETAIEDEEDEVDEDDDDEEEEEAFPDPTPRPTTTSSSLSRSPSTNTTTTTTTKTPNPRPQPHPQPPPQPTRTRSSLAKALSGEYISLNSRSQPDDPTQTTRRPRAMADALGDQSDAEVTEDDEEMGIKGRQRGEEERILEEERRERWEVSEVHGKGSGSVMLEGGGGVR